MQENECGDCTNLLISLAGELLLQAEGLIKMGLHPSEILIGYEKAADKTLALLEGLTCHTINEKLRDRAELCRCIKGTIASK